MTKREIVMELNNIKDDLRFFERAVDLVYKVQFVRGPLLEVITIFKYEKPRLYSYLKSRFENNPGLKMLFEIPIDYDTAKKSVGI